MKTNDDEQSKCNPLRIMPSWLGALELMHAFHTVSNAHELVMWLAQELHELRFPENLRNRVAASCFAVTQEHHHAVVLCLQQSPALHASAFALVRVQYEAYVRGMWFSHCATEEEVEEFSKGAEPPKMPALIKAIDAESNVEGQRLSNFHQRNWKTMCAYAHTGAQQVQRWNTGDGIEPNYDLAEVKEVLSLTSAISILSAVSVASLASNDGLAQRIIEKLGIPAPQ